MEETGRGIFDSTSALKLPKCSFPIYSRDSSGRVGTFCETRQDSKENFVASMTENFSSSEFRFGS